MRWRYGVGALDRGSRARRRNSRSSNGHRAVGRTVAAPNVLPQLKAGTPLEVFAYDRANVKMLATGRVAAMTDRYHHRYRESASAVRQSRQCAVSESIRQPQSP